MFPSSKQGFYQVSHGGSALTTGRAFSNGAAVSISGKTGTAESYVEGVKKLTIPMLWPMHHQIILKSLLPLSSRITPILQMVSDLPLHAILSTSITNTIQ